MNTLSPDAEPRAFAEAKGDVCPEAPIWPENIAFRSRGPPSAVKIRRLRLLRSCSLPHIRSQKLIQSPYTRSGSLQSNSIRNGSGGPFSAYPRTLPAGTTADRILRIIGDCEAANLTGFIRRSRQCIVQERGGTHASGDCACRDNGAFPPHVWLCPQPSSGKSRIRSRVR